MTLAVDIRSGKIVGQVVELHPAAPVSRDPNTVTVFARGEYLAIPRDTVRLETI